MIKIPHPVVVQLPIEVYEAMQVDLTTSKKDHLEERLRTYDNVIRVLEDSVNPNAAVNAITGLQVARRYAQKDLEALG